MTKKILTLDNIPVIKKNIGRIDTIEKLKASTIYSLGDVVEVLGFHAKGDGSHHKRIAKAEDDGSGEQGQNGIWWCIVHSDEVNISWFGAKPVSGFDNSDIIQKVIDWQVDYNYKNVVYKNVVKTKFPSGTFEISKTIKLAPQINFEGSVINGGGVPKNTTKILYTSNDNKNIFDTCNPDANNVRKQSIVDDAGKRDIFMYEACDSVMIKNISLTHNSIHFENWCSIGLNLFMSNGSVIENCTISNCVLPIVVSGGWGQQVKNNVFACMYFGGYFYGNTKLHVKENYFSGYRQDLSAYSIDKYQIPSALKQTHILNGGGSPIGKMQTNAILHFTACDFTDNICEGTKIGVGVWRANCPWTTTLKNTYLESLPVAGYYYHSHEKSVNLEAGFFHEVPVKLIIPTVHEHVNVSNAKDVKDFMSTYQAPSCKNVTINNVYVKKEGVTLSLGTDLVKNVKFSTSTDGFDFLGVTNFNPTSKDFGYANFCRRGSGSGLFVSTGKTVGGNGEGSFFLKNVGGNQLGVEIKTGVDTWVSKTIQFVSTYQSLDTPYYTLKMQQEGIYEDYVAYRDELHEYENSQATGDAMLLPVLQEPVIPESVKQFAEKYKLI